LRPKTSKPRECGCENSFCTWSILRINKHN
jgi:hypothetical protein